MTPDSTSPNLAAIRTANRPSVSGLSPTTMLSGAVPGSDQVSHGLVRFTRHLRLMARGGGYERHDGAGPRQEGTAAGRCAGPGSRRRRHQAPPSSAPTGKVASVLVATKLAPPRMAVLARSGPVVKLDFPPHDYSIGALVGPDFLHLRACQGLADPFAADDDGPAAGRQERSRRLCGRGQVVGLALDAGPGQGLEVRGDPGP